MQRRWTRDNYHERQPWLLYYSSSLLRIYAHCSNAKLRFAGIFRVVN